MTPKHANRHACGLNLDKYEPQIDFWAEGIGGDRHLLFNLNAESVISGYLEFGTVKAWLADDEFQVLQLVSTNGGAIYNYQKRFRKS